MDELTLEIKELGAKLLKKDFLYNKIPENKEEEFIEFAVDIGFEEAEKSLEDGLERENPVEYIKQKAEVNYEAEAPKVPVYSEAKLKHKRINLYINEIKEIQENLEIEKDKIKLDKLYNVFLLHEFFHLIEHYELDSITGQKQVVVFEIFNWQLKRGIKALSEIAAQAYVRKIVGLPFDYITVP